MCIPQCAATGLGDEPAPPFAPAHVLVIDDETMMCAALSAMLKADGYQVVTAQSGQEAVDRLRSQQFEVAITDLVMPQMDGIQTIAALKKLDPDMEVIVLTGHGGVVSAVAAIKHGACDYLLKPITMPQLCAAVARALEKRRSNTSLCLYETKPTVLAALETQEPILAVLRSAQGTMRATAAGLALAPPQGMGLHVEVSGSDGRLDEAAVKSLALHTMQARQALRDPSFEPGDPYRGEAGIPAGSILAFPLEVRGALLGALVLWRENSVVPFTVLELRSGEILAAEIAIALDNAHLCRELSRKAEELQTAHSAVARAEATARAIINSAQEAIILLDEEGVVWDLNPKALEMFGRSREETVGYNMADFAIPLRDLGHFREYLETAYRVGRHPADKVVEVSALRKNGEEFPLEILTASIETPQGKLLSTFARDITERKQAENALRESEERYRLLFENNQAGVFRTTRDGRVLHCNPAIANMLGYDSPQDASVHRVTDFYYSKDERDKFLEKLKFEGGLSSFEMRLRRKDGSPLWVLASVNCSAQASSPCQVIEGTVVDITERKLTEAAMAERHRLATLLADVGVALTGAETLRQGLQRCAEILVRDIDAAFARVWTVNERDNVLELQASAGMYTHLDGGHARVPLGKFKIGRIAESGEPHLTNTVLEDSWVGDPEWARREGMVAFAGYPLKVGERVLGVVAAFARQPMTTAVLQAFASVAYNIAQFIKRKRAEEALRESEERYRLLFERNLAGVFRATLLSRRLIDCNDAYARILGYESRQEVLRCGKLHDFYEAAEFANARARLFKEKALNNFEVRLCRKDHTRMWALANVSLIEAREGEEPLVEGTLIDITERKQAEQALAQERDLLRTLMDNIPDYIYFKDRQSRFLRTNLALAKAFGLSDPGQALGKTDFDFFTAEHAQQAYDDEQEVITTGKPIMAKEEKETWPDGRVTWASTTKMPFRDAGGALIGTFGVSRDITRRKQMEESLREISDRLQLALKSAKAGTWSWNTVDGTLYWDDHVWALFGLEPRTSPPNYADFLFAIHPDDRQAVEALVARSVQEGSAYYSEFRVIWPDGSTHFLANRGDVYQNAEGQVARMTGVTWDITEGKRAEEALRTSEQRYRRLFERNMAGVFQGTLDGRILDCNDAYARILGYNSRQEILRLEKLDYFYDPQEGMAAATLLQREGSQTNFQVRLKRRDESPVSVLANVTLAQMGEGQPPLVEGTLIDISEWKRAARALEERTTYLNTLIEISPLSIVVLDAEGCVQMSNPAFEKLFLYSRREMQGANLDELVVPGGLISEAEGFSKQCLLGASVHAISRRRRKDGTLADVEIYGVPLVMEGQPRGTLALYQDITDRKRAEEALRASEERYRELFENASDLVFTTDLEAARFTSLNRVAEQTIGYSREEAAEMNLQQLVDPKHWERIEQARRRLLAGESTVQFEVEIMAKHGRRVMLEVKPRLIFKEGKPTAVQAIGRDITGREAAEMELRHAQKLESVGRLASGIAHEINTPIQFVGDNTRFLQESFAGLQTLINKYQELRQAAASGAVSPDLLAEVRRVEGESDCAYLLEEIPKALAQTLDGVSRVATIVRAMKDFAHPESKERVAADLNKALLSTLTVARNELKYVADLETDFGDLPLVVCNISDLNQVFLNLLVNAAHAIGEVVKGTGEKGKIRVGTVAEGKTVLIAITDTGCGIPEGIRSKVFDPFFTTKEVGRGTGQGLAIARSVIVERHKGALTFESEVGKGTTFYIRLPIESGEYSEETRVP
jgi:PAS domain S-box-containing protein